MHDHNYSFTYSYGVTEITISSDSTFVWKTWDVENKKNWKKYKKYKPKISKGEITRKGDFYILTEYIDGEKTDFNWTVKILRRRLIFYQLNKKGKFKRLVKYKLIEYDKKINAN